MDVARELLEFLHRDVEVVEINQLASVGDKGDIRWDVDADAAGTDADLSSGSACVVAKKYDTLASIGRWVLELLLLLPFFPIGVLVVIAGVTSKKLLLFAGVLVGSPSRRHKNMNFLARTFFPFVNE